MQTPAGECLIFPPRLQMISSSNHPAKYELESSFAALLVAVGDFSAEIKDLSQIVTDLDSQPFNLS